MSAFIVNKDLIDLLVTVAVEGGTHTKGLRFYYEGNLYNYSAVDADELGQILTQQNYDSVNYRYQESTEVETYVYKRIKNVGGDTGAFIPWGHVLRALSCYEYQSCETPDWNQSVAYTICQAIRSKVCNRLGGDDAPWEWSRNQANARWEKLHPRVNA
jgi:hypothetical protein